MSLYTVPATAFLSVSDQADLISVAQDVPVNVFTDEEGVERVTYGTTPASDNALGLLTTSFISAIRKAASASAMLDADEAFAVALVEFVASVRSYDLSSTIPFSASIAVTLKRRVWEADRSADLIVVRDTVAKVYWRIMHAHDGDAAAAYETCRTSVNGLSASTFMSVHNVFGGVETLDPAPTSEDSGPRHALAAAIGSAEKAVCQTDLVEWLFTLVSSKESTILRLAYGFRDDATEILRLDNGFQMGEELTDLAISAIVGGAGSTVQKQRVRALDTMRSAIEADDADAL